MYTTLRDVFILEYPRFNGRVIYLTMPLRRKINPIKAYYKIRLLKPKVTSNTKYVSRNTLISTRLSGRILYNKGFEEERYY